VLNSSPKKGSKQVVTNAKQNYINNLGVNKRNQNTKTFVQGKPSKQNSNNGRLPTEVAKSPSKKNKLTKEADNEEKQNKVLTFRDFSHLSYFAAGTLT
jgi:hypothetical protein